MTRELIIMFTAGAGGSHCGACQRDVYLAQALQVCGYDVCLIPLYTPVVTDGTLPENLAPLYMGGLNVYLSQSSALFRHLPAWLTRGLDAALLLRLLSRHASATDPRSLGAMTVSMLQGRAGLQAKEFSRLGKFLKTLPVPRLVSISNSMLLGLLDCLPDWPGVPIYCGLQGEEHFLDALGDPWRQQAWDILRTRVKRVTGALASSHWHRDSMQSRLELPAEQIQVLYPPVPTQKFIPPVTAPSDNTIGYLSTITPAKGLDLLVDACSILAQQGTEFTLHIAGRIGHETYMREVQKKLGQQRWPWVYHGVLSGAEKIKLMQHSRVFCVPSRIPECRGLATLEAMGCGAGVVAPDTGALPEWVNLYGGQLFASGNAADLARALAASLAAPPPIQRTLLTTRHAPAAVATQLLHLTGLTS